jgi:hypothetical protein
MAIVRLTTCNNSFEAHLIKDKLQMEDIECFLTNENFSSLLPNFNGVLDSGVHVMIDEKDLDKAVKIIQQDSSPNEIKCPSCNSSQITYSLGKNVFSKLLVVLLSLFAWTPFSNIKRTYYCNECKTEFKI